MRRLVLLNMLLFALSVGLMGQTRLGVYAAGFYNLENLFDTEDDPNNPAMMSFCRMVLTLGRRRNISRN